MLLNSIYYGDIPIERIFKAKDIIWNYGIDFYIDLGEIRDFVIGKLFLNQFTSENFQLNSSLKLDSLNYLSYRTLQEIKINNQSLSSSSPELFMHQTLDNFKVEDNFKISGILTGSQGKKNEIIIKNQPLFLTQQKQLLVKNIEIEHLNDLIFRNNIHNGISYNIELKNLLKESLCFTLKLRMLKSIAANCKDVLPIFTFSHFNNSLTASLLLFYFSIFLNVNKMTNSVSRSVRGINNSSFQIPLIFYNGIGKHIGKDKMVHCFLNNSYFKLSKSQENFSYNISNFLNKNTLIDSTTIKILTINDFLFKNYSKAKVSLARELKDGHTYYFGFNNVTTIAKAIEGYGEVRSNYLIFSKFIHSQSIPLFDFLKQQTSLQTTGRVLPTIPLNLNFLQNPFFTGACTSAKAYDFFFLSTIQTQFKAKPQLQQPKILTFSYRGFDTEYITLLRKLPSNSIFLDTEIKQDNVLTLNFSLVRKMCNFTDSFDIDTKANLTMRFSSFYNFLQKYTIASQVLPVLQEAGYLHSKDTTKLFFTNKLQQFQSGILRNSIQSNILTNFILNYQKTNNLSARDNNNLLLLAPLKNNKIKETKKEISFIFNNEVGRIENSASKTFDLLKEKNNLEDFLKIRLAFIKNSSNFLKVIKNENRAILSMEKRTWTYPQNNGPSSLIIYQAVRADLINNTLVII